MEERKKAMKYTGWGLLILGCLPLTTQATDFKIELNPSFLKFPGDYMFALDIKNKIDRVFKVSVKSDKIQKVELVKGKSGKKAEKKAGKLASKKISFDNNVITVASGVANIPVANDLEILPLSKTFSYGSATMGLKKTSKKFTVDVGPGLALRLESAEKPRKDKEKESKVEYTVTAGKNLPDGSYTLELKIPVTAQHRKYNFDVKDHTILKVSGDDTGRLKDGKLKINAHPMCAARRAKKAGAIIGTALPVIVGSAVAAVLTGGTSLAAEGAALTAETATATATSTAAAAAELH